jgi:CBS domain-containing protein
MTPFKALQSAPSSTELNTLADIEPPEKLSWNDAALQVFDDFQRHDPIMVSPNSTLAATEKLLTSSGQRYACVTNAQHKIIGIVALREFYGRRAMQLGLQAQIPRQDVAVKDLMTPLMQLPQVEYRQLLSARIGDAAATLKMKGHDFIVIKTGDVIRGVVSSLRIAQRTGESVNIYHSASTFAEIMTAVSHKELTD